MVVSTEHLVLYWTVARLSRPSLIGTDLITIASVRLPAMMTESSVRSDKLA